MASNIKFKRSAVQNRVPTTAQLDLGELALNTYDGKLYTEINTGSAAVVEIGSKLSSLVVDGDNGAGGGDVTFHGQTAGRDVLWDYSENSLRFSASAQIKMGVNAQLFQILNDGANTNFIRSSATNLRINSDIFRVRKLDDTTTVLNASGDQISLYYGGNIRVTTTDDGADITGTGSLKLPVGTTAQRNSSPAAGDIRYNSTLGAFEGYSSSWGELGGGGIGIGSTAVNPASGLVTNRIGVGFTDINVVGSGISVTGYGSTIVLDFNDFKPGTFNRSIHNYTATAGQTTFAGLSYDNAERQIAVYLNGARLSADTYTATSGTTVVLDVGASVGDEVEIINININSDVDRNVNTYTATAGQTTFTGLSYNSITELDVYLNGIRLATGDFTATSGNTVVLNVGASVNDIVDIVSTGDGVSFRSTADTSGDKFTLTNVGIGTDQTPDKLNVRGNVNVVGVLTATTLHGDGSNLTNTGSTLSEPSSGTQRLVTTSLTTGTMTSSGTGSELTFDYANNLLKLTDSTKINLGTGGDLFLFHDGSNSFLQDAGTGVLFLDCSQTQIKKFGSNHVMANFIGGGAVELYHDNVKTFFTTTSGIQVQGASGGIGQIVLSADANEDNDDKFKLIVEDNGPFKIQNRASGSWETNIECNGNGNVELYHNNVKRFETNSVGVKISSDILVGNGTDLEIKNDSASETLAKFINNGAVELYHNNVKKFQTTSTGASVTGNLNVSGVLTYDDVTNVDSVGIITARDDIKVVTDNKSITFGASSDLSMKHDGSNSYILNNTGSFIISADTLQFNNRANNETKAKFVNNGGVELYYDNSKKLETISSGAKVLGDFLFRNTSDATQMFFDAGNSKLHVYDNSKITFGNTDDLQIYHSSGDSYITNSDGNLNIVNSTDGWIRLQPKSGEEGVIVKYDGAVELYYDNAKKFETTSSGTKFTGVLAADDNQSILLGNSDDFRIRHTGSHSEITDEGTGDLRLGASRTVIGNTAFNETQAMFIQDGAVELYHNGLKRFETSADGCVFSGPTNTTASVKIIGTEARSAEIRLVADDGDDFTDTVRLHQSINGNFYLQNLTASATFESMLVAVPNGAVELYHNNTKRFETTSTGGNLHGHFLPDTTDIRDLGSNAKKWSELHLKHYLYMPDDGRIRLGSSYDMQLFHDGSHQVLLGKTGTTYITCPSGQSVRLNKSSADNFNAESMLRAFADGAVELYYDNSKKLSTSSSGIQVEGSGILNGGGGNTTTLTLKNATDTDGTKLGHSSNSNAGFIQVTESNAGFNMQVGGPHEANLRFQCLENGGNTQLVFGTEKALVAVPNGAVELYHDNTKMAYTSSSGFEVTNGNLIAHLNLRVINDNQKLQIGAGNDLQIYHTGSHSIINNITGSFQVHDAGTEKFRVSGTGTFFKDDITLSNDNDKLNIGAGNDFQFYHDGTSSLIKSIAHPIAHYSNTRHHFLNADGSASVAVLVPGAQCEFYHNGTKRFETTSSGNRTNGHLLYLGPNNITNYVHSGGNLALTADSNMYFVADCNDTDGVAPSGEFIFGGGSNTNTDSNQDFTNAEFGNGGQPRNQYAILDENSFRPASNGGIDLGTNSLRFGNVFTQDLNLSNEGSTNDVDGTWGSYTIQEGEDDLFLINKRNGKKYKFNLTEVS